MREVGDELLPDGLQVPNPAGIYQQDGNALVVYRDRPHLDAPSRSGQLDFRRLLEPRFEGPFRQRLDPVMPSDLE